MTDMADTLPDDPGTLKAMLLAERARAERLEQIIKELQRHRFGRRAETLPEDQLLLGLEEVEQVEASGEAENEVAAPAERVKRAAKRRMNRGSLPAHLPRIEMVVDIDDHACPCCGDALHRIGEDTRERLDIVPAQFRVLVDASAQICLPGLRERGGAGAGAGAVDRGRAADRGDGRAGPRVQICRSSSAVSPGPDLCPPGHRRSIARHWPIWVGRAAFLLRPVHERLLEHTQGARPSCSPTRRRRRCSIPAAAAPRPASFWAYARDDRPWGGTDPPAVAYVYAPDRKAERPIAHLAGFKRHRCRSTAMPAIASLAPSDERSSARLLLGPRAAQVLRTRRRRSPRRSPARRSTASPRSTRSRTTIRGHSAEDAPRGAPGTSRPLVDALRAVARAQARAGQPARRKLAEAIRYALCALGRALTRFLDDGRIELDTNIVERAHPPHRDA